jgi:murein DD-endopeptidase MepM/ murein hydrolase activator NlpD
MGNACLVVFAHEGQTYTIRLLHLRKAPVLGTYKRGEVLAYTGNSGKSTGPHIHIELCKGKYRPELLYTEAAVRANLLDPEKFFNS